MTSWSWNSWQDKAESEHVTSGRNWNAEGEDRPGKVLSFSSFEIIIAKFVVYIGFLLLGEE